MEFSVFEFCHLVAVEVTDTVVELLKALKDAVKKG